MNDTEASWERFQREGVIVTNEELLAMIDDVINAYRALAKVRTNEFVLSKRALVMHWQRLTDIAHIRRLSYRKLEEP